MSPTIHREKGYRFHFFSREGLRAHIHVICASGEAKYWLLPEIELTKSQNLNRVQLKEIESIIEDHYDEFKNAWEKYFNS
jgi:hypothetical protein